MRAYYNADLAAIALMQRNTPVEAQVHWAIAYHTNSTSPRAKRWYYLTRLVKADGKWFELYRRDLDTCNRVQARNKALDAGHALLHGMFTSSPSPRIGSEMIWDRES